MLLLILPMQSKFFFGQKQLRCSDKCVQFKYFKGDEMIFVIFFVLKVRYFFDETHMILQIKLV